MTTSTAEGVAQTTWRPEEELESHSKKTAELERKLVEAGKREQVASHMTKELIGLEGKKVLVVFDDDTTEEFFVGVTDYKLPSHVKLDTLDSDYGDPVTKRIKNVTVIS